MNDVTLILDAVARGEAQPSEDLLPVVYQELRRHAAVRMAREYPGQTLQPTALVHEAWLRLVGDGERRWQNRAHFFGAAAEAMRRILIEKARQKSRVKRGSNPIKLDIDDLEVSEIEANEKVLLIDEALERFKAQDPERAQVVLLKFFAGCSHQEVAALLGVTERTVERHWSYAKAWLFRSIQQNG